jgi:hypothetical protein
MRDHSADPKSLGDGRGAVSSRLHFTHPLDRHRRLAVIRFLPGSERHGESATSGGAVQKLRSFCTAVYTTVSQGT